MTDLERALLKTLLFHATWHHAPTLVEWIMTLEWTGEPPERSAVIQAIHTLTEERIVLAYRGRYVLFTSGSAFIDEQRRNEFWHPRKLRAARRVAEWLLRLSSVRFVALCNTTALGHARDEGDLDFFVITKRNTLMATRALAVLPYKVLGQRPGEHHGRDAVCLSYFVADDGLDLSSHMLKPDDPYFRYWFLSLLPLYDDGASEELWRANGYIVGRHPLARPWLVSPDLRIRRPRLQIPVLRGMEKTAAIFQEKHFPPQINEVLNQDTRVMVTSQVLKFHVEDRREEYRKRYEEACERRGL